ncbi:hypothetical protein ACKWTF_010780 [Chironomus riparius]
MIEIKNLPEHILIEIFSNLSPKMIKSCCLVCKSWNEIIANTTELMDNYVLNLNKPYEVSKSAKEIERKHQSALVKDLSQDSLDDICRHNLKSLKISGTIRESLLVEALNNLPDLKDLDAENVEFVYDKSNTVNFMKVHTNLQQLKCDVGIVHIFGCSALKKLQLMTEEYVNYDKKTLIHFLQQQKELQELILIEINDDIFCSFEILQLKLSLKSLSYSKFEPILFYNNLIRFLRLQKDSLTSLELDICTNPKFGIDQLHEFSLKNLKNLRHLQLGFVSGEVHNNMLSFQELTPEKHTAKNIESLDFRSGYDLNEAKGFFKMLPNIKTLTFEAGNNYIIGISNDVELLQYISATHTKLEVLNLSALMKHAFNDVFFPNLKEFSFINIDNEEDDDIQNFIKYHLRTLEKITLPDARIITETVANEIMKCEKLKSFKLSAHKSSLSFLKLFRNISSKSPFTFITIMDDIKEIFKFPDDKAIWDEKIESLSDEAQEFKLF